MPRARISREQYDALVASYRELPGNVDVASRAAEVHYRTAKRAYHEGWPKPPWARGIKQMLAEEQAKIRAAADEEERKVAEHGARLREEREKAERDMVGQELRELQAIRAAMTNGTALLGIVSQLGMALVPSVEKIREMLTAAPIEDAQKLIGLLGQVVRMGHRITSMVDTSIKMERRRVGEPGEIVAVQHTATPTLFDATRAVELLGSEEEVVQALKDLADGTMTDRAARVLEACQVPHAPGVH